IIANNSKVVVITEVKIYDYIDGTFRNDTPEEDVRKNIEKRLVNEHKYSKELIRIEYTLKLGSRRPRADIVIFPDGCENFTQENIEIIIECKKESVEPQNKKEDIEKLQSDMTASTNSEWVMWIN